MPFRLMGGISSFFHHAAQAVTNTAHNVMHAVSSVAAAHPLLATVAGVAALGAGVYGFGKAKNMMSRRSSSGGPVEPEPNKGILRRILKTTVSATAMIVGVTTIAAEFAWLTAAALVATTVFVAKKLVADRRSMLETTRPTQNKLVLAPAPA